MTAPPFELLRFTGAPAGPEVAVLELEGHFDAGTWRGRDRARLLVEAGEHAIETPTVATSDLTDGGWRGTYAVPLAALDGAEFSLAVGRLLLGLPAPDLAAVAGSAATHHVRLAREANELRRRLDAGDEARLAAERRATEASEALERERARASAAEAARDREAERAASELAARERAEAEEREAREAVAEAVSTADDRVEAAQAEAEQTLTAARDEHERALATLREERDSALATLREEHERALAAAREEAERKEAEHRAALDAAEQEATRREEDAVAGERARASVTRHELRAARAELESLRRELAVRRGPGARRPDRLRLGGSDGTEGEEPTTRTVRDEDATADHPAIRAARTRDLPGDDAPADTGEEPTTPAPARPRGDQPTVRSAAASDGSAVRALPPNGNGTGEEPTVRTPPGEALAVAAERTARVPPDEGEGFRVLTPGATRPRHRIEDEHEPETLPPGAAATGARSIEAAATARSSDSARALAVAALAVAIIAALLVVVLRVGLV